MLKIDLDKKEAAAVIELLSRNNKFKTPSSKIMMRFGMSRPLIDGSGVVFYDRTVEGDRWTINYVYGSSGYSNKKSNLDVYWISIDLSKPICDQLDWVNWLELDCLDQSDFYACTRPACIDMERCIKVIERIFEKQKLCQDYNNGLTDKAPPPNKISFESHPTLSINESWELNEFGVRKELS